MIDIRTTLAITLQKSEGKSCSSTCGRITYAGGRVLFIRSAARKGRAIFLHQKASRASLFVRIYPTHSPFGIATVAPVFYASNIAHTVLHPPDLARGRGHGKRV